MFTSLIKAAFLQLSFLFGFLKDFVSISEQVKHGDRGRDECHDGRGSLAGADREHEQRRDLRRGHRQRALRADRCALHRALPAARIRKIQISGQHFE